MSRWSTRSTPPPQPRCSTRTTAAPPSPIGSHGGLCHGLGRGRQELACALALLDHSSSRPAGWDAAVNLLTATGGLVLLTVAASSHGGTGQWALVTLVATMVHVGAMSVWLGGLSCLCVLAARRRLAAVTDVELARFSALARRCMLCLLGSGAVLTWRLTGLQPEVWVTPYGAALLVKLVLVALPMSCAIRTRAVSRQREPFRVCPAAPAELTPEGRPASGALGRSTLTERLVGAAVVVAAAVLVATGPPG